MSAAVRIAAFVVLLVAVSGGAALAGGALDPPERGIEAHNAEASEGEIRTLAYTVEVNR